MRRDDDDCFDCLFSSAAQGIRLTVELTTKLVYGLLGLMSCVSFWRAPAFIAACRNSNDWESLCAENFRYVFLDFITLPFGVFALAVPWRIPAILADYSRCLDREQHPFYCLDLRRQFVLQFFYSFFDVLFVPVALLACLLPWRTFNVIAHVKHCLHQDEELPYSMAARWALLENLLYAAIDVFVIPIGLMAMILPWRTIPCYQEYQAKLAAEPNSFYCSELRQAMVVNLLRSLMDVLFVPMGVFACSALWRVQNVLRHYQSKLDADPNAFYCSELRFTFLIEFVSLIFDLATIPFGVFACFAFWRISTMWDEYQHLLSNDQSFYCTELRQAFVQNFFLSLIDVCLAPFYLFGLVAPWRTSAVLQHRSDLLAAHQGFYCVELRTSSFHNFFVVFFDIIVIPFGVMAMAPPWRTKVVYDHYWEVYNAHPNEPYVAALRWAAINNFFYAILDVIMAPFFVLSMLPPWRTMSVWTRYQQCIANEPGLYCSSLRWAAFEECIIAVVDVVVAPFGLMAMVPPWRTAAVWNHYQTCVANEPNSTWVGELRIAALMNFAGSCLDVALIPIFAAALILPWRTMAVWNHFQQCLRDEPNSFYCTSLRWAAVQNAILGLVDIFLSPFFAMALIAPWRTLAVWSYFQRCLANEPESHYVWKLREAAVAGSIYNVVDVFLLPFFAISIALPWRTFTMLAYWKHLLDDDTESLYCWEVRRTAVVGSFLALIDVGLIPVFAISILPPWRTLYVIEHYQQVYEQHPDPFYCTAVRHAMLENAMYAGFDCLLIPFFFLSLALPWRIIQVYRLYRAYLDREPGSHYVVALRYAIIENTFYFAMDCLVMPLGVLAMLLPWRTKHVWAHYESLLEPGADAVQDIFLNHICIPLRWAMLENFMYAIIDVCLCPFGVLACLAVWRVRFVWIHYEYCLSQPHGHYCMLLRLVFVQNFLYALADLMFIPLGLFSLMLPWRTYHAGHTFWHIFEENKRNFEYDWSLRFEFPRQILLAAIDAFVFPFFAITLCSIIRTRALLDGLKFALQPYEDRPHIYVENARTVVFTVFFRLLFDLFTFPFYLAVVITIYRFPALSAELENVEGVDRHLAILSHFFMLLCDLPFFFPLAIMTLTLWRLPALIASGAFKMNQPGTRSLIMAHFLHWFANIILFILILLCELSILRTVPTTRELFLGCRLIGQLSEPHVDRFFDEYLLGVLHDQLYELYSDVLNLILFAFASLMNPLRGVQIGLQLLEAPRLWRMRLLARVQPAMTLAVESSQMHARAVEQVGQYALKKGLHREGDLQEYMKEFLDETGDIGRFSLLDWQTARDEMLEFMQVVSETADKERMSSYDESLSSWQVFVFGPEQPAQAIANQQQASPPQVQPRVNRRPSLLDEALPAFDQQPVDLENNAPLLAGVIPGNDAPPADLVVAVAAAPVAQAVVASAAVAPAPFLADNVLGSVREFVEYILARHSSAALVSCQRVRLEHLLAQDVMPYHAFQTAMQLQQLNAEQLTNEGAERVRALDETHHTLVTNIEQIQSSFSILNPWRRPSTMVRQMMKQAMRDGIRDWYLLLCTLPIVLTLIRFPTLWNRFSAGGKSRISWRQAAESALAELWLDFLAFLQLLFLTLTLRRAFKTWGLLFTYLIYGNVMVPSSVNATRLIISEEFRLFFATLGGTAQAICSALSGMVIMCDCQLALRAISTVVAGFFMPFVSFREILHALFSGGCISRQILTGIAIICWILAFALPIYISASVVSSALSTSAAGITLVDLNPIQTWYLLFFALLLLYLIFSFWASKSDPQARKISRPSRRIVSNMQNGLALLSVLVEALQLAAMPLVLLANPSTNIVATGSTVLDWVAKIGRHILLVENGELVISFAFGAGIIGVWYLTITAPIVSDVISARERRRDDNRYGDEAAVDLFANPLYISIVRFISQHLYLPLLVFSLRALYCSNTIVGDAILIPSNDLTCYHDSQQQSLVTLGIYCVFFYIISANTYSTSLDFGKSRAGSREEVWDAREGLDIKFPAIFTMFFNIIKLFLVVGLYLVSGTQPNGFLFLCFVCAGIMIVWTLFYPRWFATAVDDGDPAARFASIGERGQERAQPQLRAVVAQRGDDDEQRPGEPRANSNEAGPGQMMIQPEVCCITGVIVFQLAGYTMMIITAAVTFLQLRGGFSSIDLGHLLLIGLCIVAVIAVVVTHFFPNVLRSEQAAREVELTRTMVCNIIERLIEPGVLRDADRNDFVRAVNKATLPPEFASILQRLEGSLPIFVLTKRFFLARMDWLEALSTQAGRNFESLVECIRSLEAALNESAERRRQQNIEDAEAEAAANADVGPGGVAADGSGQNAQSSSHRRRERLAASIQAASPLVVLDSFVASLEFDFLWRETSPTVSRWRSINYDVNRPEPQHEQPPPQPPPQQARQVAPPPAAAAAAREPPPFLSSSWASVDKPQKSSAVSSSSSSSSSAPASSSIAVAAQGRWNCPSCTLENEAGNTRCQVCDTQRPPAAAVAVASSSSSSSSSSSASSELKSGQWTCRACTAINENSSARQCEVCGSNR